MTDSDRYAEERRSELEVLESIFPDELTGSSPSPPLLLPVLSWYAAVISEDKLSIRVEPEIQNPAERCQFRFEEFADCWTDAGVR